MQDFLSASLAIVMVLVGAAGAIGGAVVTAVDEGRTFAGSRAGVAVCLGGFALVIAGMSSSARAA